MGIDDVDVVMRTCSLVVSKQMNQPLLVNCHLPHNDAANDEPDLVAKEAMPIVPTRPMHPYLGQHINQGNVDEGARRFSIIFKSIKQF